MFRDSAVENLSDFFAAVPPAQSVGGNEELNSVVAEAEGLMRGVDPADLRAKHRRRLAAGPGSRWIVRGVRGT